MKNREKFAKEIMDIACAGHSIAFDTESNKLTNCQDINCTRCAFSMVSSRDSCRDRIKEWCESEYIEPEVDWSKVPVDTPVLVKDDKCDKWINRYFAYYRDGKVFAYDCGATSWSVDNSFTNTNRWEYAKLANEEDISKYAK